MSGGGTLPFVPYCGEPAAASAIGGAWNLGPILLLAFALAALFGIQRLRDTSPMRRACFAGAWGLLFVALVSPLCNLTSALFSARVAQHLLIIQLAPPLLLLSGVLSRTKRPAWRIGVGPVWVAHGALIWLWHLPAPYEAALRWSAILWLMHGSLFFTALAAWRTLLASAPGEAARAVLAAFGTSAHMGLLGALLTFAPAPLFGYHLFTSHLWGLTALEDQQLAGLVMWIIGCTFYAAAALAVLAKLLRALEALGPVRV